MRTRGSERRGWNRTITWGVLGFLAAGVAAVLFIQRQSTERLRGEIAEDRAQLERQAEELIRKGEKQVDDTTSVAELTRLRGDREVLEKLRAEVGLLKKSVAETRPLPMRKPKAADGSTPDITNEIVPSDAWRNAGYATPVAAVETALWAAAGGDTDVLMQSIVLDDGARRKATELLAGLPAETRARYSKPEELVAFMAAKDVPLEGARIFSSKEPPGVTQRTVVQLRNAAGSVRQVHLELRKTDAGWQLVVPESAVDRYAESLKLVRTTTAR